MLVFTYSITVKKKKKKTVNGKKTVFYGHNNTLRFTRGGGGVKPNYSFCKIKAYACKIFIIFRKFIYEISRDTKSVLSAFHFPGRFFELLLHFYQCALTHIVLII